MHILKTERSQINDLMLHLKPLEKQEPAEPQTSKKINNKIKDQNQ
jgi:hypothetical protein